MSKVNIMEWVKKVFDFIRFTFEDIVKDVVSLPATKQFMKDAGEIVRQEVLNADEQIISGGEKRDLAFKNIEDSLKSAGINYSVYLINWAIENAVMWLREKAEK